MEVLVSYAALCFASGVLLWVEWQPYREAKKRREELLRKYPHLRRHLD